MDSSLQIILILKALTEVAGVAFLGQGVLWVIAGAKRGENLVYKIFVTLTSPVTKVARFITPRIVLDQHIGLVVRYRFGRTRPQQTRSEPRAEESNPDSREGMRECANREQQDNDRQPTRPGVFRPCYQFREGQ